MSRFSTPHPLRLIGRSVSPLLTPVALKASRGTERADSQTMARIYEPTCTGPAHPCRLYVSALAGEAKLPFPPNPDSLIHKRVNNLSAAQRDAVCLVRARHKKSMAALVADGTGVGKGRTLVSVVVNNFASGDAKRAVYVSASNLFEDLKRDVDACANGLRVVDARSSGFPDEGIVFVPYASLGGKMAALRAWLQPTSTLVFDEAHSARNLGGKTSAAQAVATKTLFDAFPARVVFATATPADTLANFEYLLPLLDVRTSTRELRTRFGGQHGASILELLFHELVACGALIARSIGFDGVQFERHEVPPTQEEKAQWDAASAIWNEIWKIDIPRTSAGKIGCAAQRFGLARILHSKVDATVARAQQALCDGKQVVISLISTDEGAAERATAAQAAETEASAGLEENLMIAVKELEELGLAPPGLRDRVKALALPQVSPLSMLKDRLGGVHCVAELTGRQNFYSLQGGIWTKTKRQGTVTDERKAFQAGRKRVCILSTACGVGVSLHDTNGAQRVHILFQMAWSSTAVMQALGRSHRSGQLSAPKYLLMASTYGPERRVTAAVAQRLEALGAIATGDRETDNVRLDDRGSSIMQYATPAANAVIRGHVAIVREHLGLAAQVDRGQLFLNRLLVAPFDVAEQLFAEFLEHVNAVEMEAVRRGTAGCPVRTFTDERAVVTQEIKVGNTTLSKLTNRTSMHWHEIVAHAEDLRKRGNTVYFSGNSMVWKRARTVSVVTWPNGFEQVSNSIYPETEVDQVVWEQKAQEAEPEKVHALQLPCMKYLLANGVARMNPAIARMHIGGERHLAVQISGRVARDLAKMKVPDTMAQNSDTDPTQSASEGESDAMSDDEDPYATEDESSDIACPFKNDDISDAEDEPAAKRQKQ